MQMRQFPALAIALAVLCGSGQALRRQSPRTVFPLAPPPVPQIYPTPLAITYVATGQKPAVIASLGLSDELKAFLKPGDWNQYHDVIARGDAEHRNMYGLIGVQVHGGPPMEAEYRSILLKELP